MKHFKINIGRRKISSEYIQSKQNFDNILQKLQKQSNNSARWNFWTYGVSSLAIITIVLGTAWKQKNKQKKQIIANTEVINNINQPVLIDINTRTTTEKYNAISVVETQQNNTNRIEKVSKQREIVLKKVQCKDDIDVSITELDSEKKSDDNVTEIINISSKQFSQERSPMQLSISGIHGGNISWEQFNEGELLINNEYLKICAFSIQYTSRRGDKTVAVQGTKIPKDVLSDLNNIAIDQIVFVTNVIANNESGEKHYLPSMELNLKFNNKMTQNIQK